MDNTLAIEFNTIDELLNYLPKRELKIVLFLRKIILKCIPNCKENLAYNVPFFYGHSQICYLWPASISLGKVEKGVAIGFCKGTSFLDETFETAKFASKLTFDSLKDIDVILLKQQIYGAVLVDNQIVKAKRRKIQ